jgi:RNA ligase (TIGR02306 family)
MRKLASIQAIESLSPIPNADAIEVARVLGWEVVVKKGEFRVGERVVYCEIDSRMPERPEFEFLRPRGFRIRTVRLRGQVSQGICFPLAMLGETEMEIGADVTDRLGITKYEPPLPPSAAAEIKGGFPGWLPKTDEIRLQAVPELLERHAEVEFYVTEKLDGMSCSVWLDADGLNVAGRNWKLKFVEGNAYWRAAAGLEEKLNRLRTDFGADLALQGEVVGPGIQKNLLALPEVTFKCFGAFDRATRTFLDFEQFVRLTEAVEISTVPILDPAFRLAGTVGEMVAFATRKSVINPKNWAEGVVVRSKTERYEPATGGRLSFKVINPEFLLKHDD